MGQGLPLEYRLQDYRELNERFDRVVSVGMFEHVGHKNYRTYMEVAHRCLKDDGLFLLHTIGKNERASVPDPWIDKYIFPNGALPSIGQIGDAADGLFIAEDLHNFGADYDKTLMAWCRNFESAWPRFSAQLGERFYRMWRLLPLVLRRRIPGTRYPVVAMGVFQGRHRGRVSPHCLSAPRAPGCAMAPRLRQKRLLSAHIKVLLCPRLEIGFPDSLPPPSISTTKNDCAVASAP